MTTNDFGSASPSSKLAWLIVHEGLGFKLRRFHVRLDVLNRFDLEVEQRRCSGLELFAKGLEALAAARTENFGGIRSPEPANTEILDLTMQSSFTKRVRNVMREFGWGDNDLISTVLDALEAKECGFRRRRPPFPI